ncbi:D-amino-acid transaminase [Evansella sp. AB-P1]|uniref:D-amino-acid transaminase n=1 Tax=Evansella sp. AB-P1 TaxID=3037653 RepID=UPI00241EF562|nr:D-amino-acid transaminase [Evansella sp. AB-P1]MDG5786879.1 D-amino-acid transaminase [Evansella sp. AB-P1]
MREIAYYIDQFIDIDDKVIPIQERGHQFGDGIYEVVRVYDGSPFLLNEHMDRLEKSAEGIELQLPYSRAEIIRIIMDGIKRSEMKEAEVYFQVTRGISPRQHHYPDTSSIFSMTIRHARKMGEEKRKNGISIMILEDERWKNCYIKSLNLLPNIMAKHKAVGNGCGEAVFEKEGIITEGSSSNIFAVKNNVLYTHPATKAILHGITRAKVIQLAKENNIIVKEEAFTVDFLKDADEAFITGTTTEILPIALVSQSRLPNQRPISTLLIELYKKQHN